MILSIINITRSTIHRLSTTWHRMWTLLIGFALILGFWAVISILGVRIRIWFRKWSTSNCFQQMTRIRLTFIFCVRRGWLFLKIYPFACFFKFVWRLFMASSTFFVNIILAWRRFTNGLRSTRSGGYLLLSLCKTISLILLSTSLFNSKVRWWALSISGISWTCSLLCWFCCALSFTRFACTLWCTLSRVESQPRCCSTTRSTWDAALCGRSSPESLATSSGASSTGSSSSTTKCKSSVWPGPTYLTPKIFKFINYNMLNFICISFMVIIGLVITLISIAV